VRVVRTPQIRQAQRALVVLLDERHHLPDIPSRDDRRDAFVEACC
jgi:hypothetical protein